MLDKNNRSRKSLSREINPQPVIDIGSSFAVRDHRTGELDIYTLVLPVDADISRNKVSTLTPLGQAIYGRKTGDVVKYMAPGGLIKMRIESVRLAPVNDLTVETP